MNLTYTRPGELRKPDVEVLPDGRIRITRYIAAGHGDRDLSEVTESVGTADKGLQTALLVKRGMAQVAGKDAIVKTYEVMNPSAETQVGLPDVQYTESGQKTMVYDFVQMSSGTYTPGVIGTTAAPGDANCILRTEQVEDDGTTRQIRRVFINKGLLQQTDETKNNGALLLKTFVYLNDAPIPNPPTGYTLVSQQTQNPNGLETTTYVYAKGDGEISRDIEYSDSGNQGTTGVTRTTIRYLVAPSGTVQPVSLAGSVLIGSSVQDLEGHRIWTTNWAKGTGKISQEDSTSNNGALLRRTIRQLAAPASANPIVTPALYTLINESYQDSEGYRIWVATYASGNGQISQDDTTSNNGALRRRTIRHLVAPASANPIATPAGYTLIEEAYQDADGHRVWTSSYAQGVGKISQQDSTSNNGALLRRTIRYLSSPSGSNPIVAPVGYTLIDESYQEADGHRIWSASYAKGSGQISQDDATANNGALLRRTIRHLVEPAAANPITTPVGYTLVDESYQDADGHRIWVASYAKGNGQISQDDATANNGALLRRTIRHLVAPAVANPIVTPVGYTLVDQSYQDSEGHRIWTAIYAKGDGEVSRDIQYSNSGNQGAVGITRTTIRYLVAPNATVQPTALTGFIEVGRSVQDADGHRIWTTTWAKGSGQISYEVRYSQSSDFGATGVTVTTIRHLTLISVASNPIVTPAGTVLISEDKADQEGYRVWTAVYAKGSGTVSSSTDVKSGNKLVVYRKVSLGAVPTAPTSTIGGVVTQISSTSRNESGYVIYDYAWAEGIGEIARETRYGQSINQGGAGTTVISIRHITANSVAANPISAPAGTVLISVDYADQDGYRIWSGIYASGTGTVSSSTDTRQGGQLVVYRKVALGAAPSAPAATHGGTVVLISESSRNDSGYVIYESTWAEGVGEISYDVRYAQSLDQGTTGATIITIRHLTSISVNTNPISTPAGTVLINEERSNQDGYRIWTAVYAKGGSGIVASVKDTQNGGKLVIYRRSSIGAAPTAPTPTIGGSVISINQTSRTDSGYTVYEYSWAEGIGIVGERIQYREGGLRLLNREIFLAQGTSNYSAYAPTGIEVDSGFTEADGVRRYSVTWMQSSTGGSPLTNPALQFVSKVTFTYPGRAKAYFESFTTGAYVSHKAYDVFLSPPIDSLIDATTIVYYKTSNTAPSPSVGYTLWNPTGWATMRAKWVGWANSPKSKVEGLRGYRAVNSGASGTSGGTGWDTSVLGDRVYASTDWSIELSGGPTSPDGQNLTLSIQQVPAFTGTDGTQYYRVTEVYATVPSQTALPV